MLEENLKQRSLKELISSNPACLGNSKATGMLCKMKTLLSHTNRMGQSNINKNCPKPGKN